MLRVSHLIDFSLLGILLLFACHAPVQADSNSKYSPFKILGFNDPLSGYLYRVVAYNASQMAADSTHRSIIQVSRIKSTTARPHHQSEQEIIQKIGFHPTLVDFDLHCMPEHCYMVAVTSRSRLNVELYRWQRTQFDLVAKRNSFSRPTGVKLFRIQSGFYIVIAQEQLHLAPYKLAQEHEEPTRFIGCAVLKFNRGHENNIKYHQFIRLPFNPQHVSYFTSYNSNNQSSNAIVRPTQNHYLVFSVSPNWTDGPEQTQSHAYIWSPLNDHFWPYRLPRGAEFSPKPGSTGQVVKFPSPPQVMNLTRPSDYVLPVESCFFQLQRLLADRDLQVRRLIDSSRTVWRLPPTHDGHDQPLTNITARVIVHGNVTVGGSLIESPQISLIGGRHPPVFVVEKMTNLINYHSPVVVDDKLKKAFYKLKHIREKLSHAVLAADFSPSLINHNSQIRFFGPIKVDEITFSGIANSNVRLNSIPFKQLETELISLRGSQNVGPKVEFTGTVTADFLEIHGLVNGKFFMEDALDISSKHVQVIDVTGQNYIQQNSPTVDFRSVSAPELVISHNATFNGIRLEEFIIRDNRTHFVSGRKSFKRLSMSKLELANRDVQLNGLNLTRLAYDAIRLRPTAQRSHQFINGNHMTFSKPIRVNKLTINNIINQHINISTLIHDSVKTNDISSQQISGHKNFLNGLKIARLTTDGSINGVQINQIFNLNPLPPVSEAGHFMVNQQAAQIDVPITGNFAFRSFANIQGDLNVQLINGIDIARRAVRRAPYNLTSINMSNTTTAIPQIIRGRKIFNRPLRILDKVALLTQDELKRIAGSPTNGSSPVYPLINGIDLRSINDAIAKQMRQPPLIYVQNLEVDGNFYLPTTRNYTGFGPRTTFGNYSYCPLDALRSKLVLAGSENQFIDIPIRIESLRSKSITLESSALNGFSFPNDFVLRSMSPSHQTHQLIEPIYGRKKFEHLVIVPSIALNYTNRQPAMFMHSHNQFQPNLAQVDLSRRIRFDKGTSVNQLNYVEIQDFILHERQRNSTGENVFNTVDVYGNIRASRINGYYWPDDILLKSASSPEGPMLPNQNLHKRIYSPLIFLDSSSLQIDNQLVLRGPIQMQGKLNGINLTEFARQSATYGDKDLMSTTRPIRNKIFLGGLTVTGEIRSEGLIDGVNIEEMKNRVVTIGGPNALAPRVIQSPKAFLSDTLFSGPVRMSYLNDLPLDNYLRSLRFESDGQTVKVFGKKTITGALIAKNLIVRGRINGINFEDLKAKAIPLVPNQNRLQFNKTLTIEGDVFMDNLLVDEKNGLIDGVRLANLLPIQRPPVSILYEQQLPQQVDRPIVHIEPLPRPSPLIHSNIDNLRKKVMPLKLAKLISHHDLVAGFIEAPQDNLRYYLLPEEEPSHIDHIVTTARSFLQLDQIDFPFRPTTYHLSVVVETNRDGRNITSVLSSVKDSPMHQLSVLPIEWPNNAMFLRVADALFLLISQDYTQFKGKTALCPTFGAPPTRVYLESQHQDALDMTSNQAGVGIHVYLFHALQNSSSLTSAYFDLYQTIDLPSVDSFVNFNYRGLTYVITVSRSTARMHLLLLRGYSGFQEVSYVDIPGIDYVKLMSTAGRNPALIVYLKNGMHRVMESVII